jgi:hypothetical protein
MFTQLSLFDSATLFDTTAPVGQAPVSRAPIVTVPAPVVRRQAVVETDRAEAERIESACRRKTDEVRPMGELAQLVLARYDLMIRRREELERRRREQPRRSIRVLGPPAVSSRRAVAAGRSEYAMASCAG